MTAAQVEALPEKDAQAVLEAWVKAKKPELPLTLRESASKAHARLAKKALYQLQSSGVTVEAPKREAPPAAEETGNPFQAVLSSQLGTGERVMFFATPNRTGGAVVYQAIVHDELGLAQFGSEETTRQKFRRRLAEIQNSEAQPVMLVSFDRARQELARALWLSEKNQTEITTEISQALQRLKITPEDANFEIPPLEAGDAAAREDGAKLHDEKEISEWYPSESDLIALSAKSLTAELGAGDAAEKKAKKESLARAMADEKFTAEVRTLYARRLWYQGEYFEARGRAEAAARARGEARRLMHSTEPSRFAQQLYVKAIGTRALSTLAPPVR